MKIACIGGGPAADALGVIKFLESSKGVAPKLRFTFLDREPAWQPVRDALFSTFQGFDYKRRISNLDLSAGPKWTKSWTFANADIFTISFCLSEVWSFDGSGSVSNFLDKLISRAKSGALFVYTDNGGPTFLPKAEACFNGRADVKLIYSEDDEKMLIGHDEQQSYVQEYIERYKQNTKMTGKVNRRIWKKL